MASVAFDLKASLLIHETNAGKSQPEFITPFELSKLGECKQFNVGVIWSVSVSNVTTRLRQSRFSLWSRANFEGHWTCVRSLDSFEFRCCWHFSQAKGSLDLKIFFHRGCGFWSASIEKCFQKLQKTTPLADTPLISNNLNSLELMPFVLTLNFLIFTKHFAHWNWQKLSKTVTFCVWAIVKQREKKTFPIEINVVSNNKDALRSFSFNNLWGPFFFSAFM